MSGETFELREQISSETVARIPVIYREMAKGRWLIYEGVPTKVASALASKLECRVWAILQTEAAK